MINPQELKNKTFSKGITGYNCAEVDKYLAYILEQYTEAYKDNAELEKKLRNMSLKLEQAKSEESIVSTTIMNAQKMADQIIKDANVKAKAITEAVRSSFEQIINAYKDRAVKEQNNYEALQKKAIEFKSALMEGYKKHVELIDELVPFNSVDEIPQASDEELVELALKNAGEKISGNAGFDAENEQQENTADSKEPEKEQE